MKAEDVRNAYAMPLTNPAYPPGPYRFIDREYAVSYTHLTLPTICSV